MSVKNIKVFFQNIWKNNLLTNTILETYISFDVIFIQEPSWTTIHLIPSLKSEDGEILVGVPNHPNWLIFSRTSSSANDFPKVIMYINIRLSPLCFSLYKYIFNHRDISIISFFNQNNIFFLINIYSEFSQLALKYFKNTEVNINNVLIMTGDFNIRDSLWGTNY